LESTLGCNDKCERFYANFSNAGYTFYYQPLIHLELHPRYDFVSTINGHPKGCFKLTRAESIAIAEVMEKILAWQSSTFIEEGKVID